MATARTILGSLIASVGACAATALAQPGVNPDALVPIDHLVADRDPLAVSFRESSADLREELDFGRVFVDPSRPNEYVRISGALYAVSTETLYAYNRRFVWPIIAPGTVFYIGAPYADPAPAARDGSRGGSAEIVSVPVSPDHRLPAFQMTTTDERANAGRPVAGERREPTATTMSDESYRSARVWSIVRRYQRDG